MTEQCGKSSRFCTEDQMEGQQPDQRKQLETVHKAVVSAQGTPQVADLLLRTKPPALRAHRVTSESQTEHVHVQDRPKEHGFGAWANTGSSPHMAEGT